MADAVRNKQPAFGEALQCISDFPLNPSEAFAIGRVEALVDHHGADDIGRADRLPRPAKRVQDAPRQFTMFEPEIGLPDALRWDRLRFQFRSKQAQRGVKMDEIGAKLAKLPLCSGDQTGNLGSFANQRRHNVAFRRVPSSISKRSRGLLSSG